jgi:hypothetical protein
LSGLFLFVAVLSGCTARVGHFKDFASAGEAYADAQKPFLDSAAVAAIDTDSVILQNLRSTNPGANALKASLLESNTLLRQRLELLANVQRHALLLRTYFVALGDLANSDAPSSIGKGAQGVVDSLSELSSKIKNATIGQASVNAVVGQVVPIVVADFQMEALNAELKARAPVIERELDLQKAALSVIRDSMKTDLQAQLNFKEVNDIDAPFIEGTKPLPADWADRRRELLKATLALGNADAAVDAATHLKQSFISLTENRFDSSDLPSLMADINRMITLAQNIHGK